MNEILTNADRVCRFEASALAHADGEWTVEEGTIDLLADALHYWGTEAFDNCLRIARDHYEEEKDDETENSVS